MTSEAPIGSKAELAAVKATVTDYVAGWYDGDTERIERALHPDLMKRMPLSDQPGALRQVSCEQMIDLTEAGGGEDPDAKFEIDVDGIYGPIATARVWSPEYLDYLHLVMTPQGWRIVNILFRMHD